MPLTLQEVYDMCQRTGKTCELSVYSYRDRRRVLYAARITAGLGVAYMAARLGCTQEAYRKKESGEFNISVAQYSMLKQTLGSKCPRITVWQYD